jgi:hypothetical protein
VILNLVNFIHRRWIIGMPEVLFLPLLDRLST